MPQIYKNQCYRNGPCLHGTPLPVKKEKDWDYYDRQSKGFIYLDCRLKQKYYTQSVLEEEVEEQYLSGMNSSQREHRDLQLADTDGTWFTRSDDPENYLWSEWESDESIEDLITDEPKNCNQCETICEIRDDDRYLDENRSCPFPDSGPRLQYQKVEDYDRSCEDFLHPLLLQDIESLNRKKKRMAKAKLGGYLKQKKWRDILIDKGERIVDVWKRNYQPATFFYKSFETVWLYMKNIPPEMKGNKHLLQRIRKNIEYSPSYRKCLEKGEWERRMLENIDSYINRVFQYNRNSNP